MPANAGGANGTVTHAGTSTTAGNFAKVHYDDPPPAGRDETYNDITQAQLIAFCSALPKVDVTCDLTGAVTGVTAHR